MYPSIIRSRVASLLLLLVVAGGTCPIRAETLEGRVAVALKPMQLEEQLGQLSSVGETLALEEIPEALRVADTLPKLRDRGVFRQAVLKRWAKLAPEQAFPVIAALPEGRDKVEALRYVAVQSAQKDTSAVIEAVMRLPAGRSQSEALQGIAEVWARSEPAKAAAWAATLPAGATRAGALYAIWFVWVHSDPVEAARLLIPALSIGNIKNALLTNVAMEWALRDPAAAIKWAGDLAYEDERELALSRAVESWADRDPAAASEYLVKSLPGWSNPQVVAAVAERWATQDPESAAKFAARLKQSELRQAAFAPVMQLWASVDPAEAGRWSGALAPGPVREDAVSAYLAGVAAWAPDVGLKFMALEAPELVATAGAEACARQWLALDFATASPWIAEVKLAEDIKAKWCTPLPQ